MKIPSFVMSAIVLSISSLQVKSFAIKSKSKLPHEDALRERGFRYIIGSDEVGRGCIAGPVLATSCCIFTDNSDEIELVSGIRDSKELTAEQRNDIYEQIINVPSLYKWKCAQRSPKDIEESNILKATMECFRDSIQELVLLENIPLDLAYSIVDGKSTPKLVNGPTPIPCRPMVNADAKVYTVSLASIIAKVTRDRIMTEAHEIYPMYNFHVNKGYGTRDHIERIHKYGPCPLHRMSFKALKHR